MHQHSWFYLRFFAQISVVKKLGEKRRNEIVLHGRISDKREGTNKQFPQTE